MKFGIYTDRDELQKTRPWVYTPKGYAYEENEDKVIMHLRPWTRTTQAIVDKRARTKNIAIMDADEMLKGIGSGDKKGEAYVRELADYLISDWEGVVFANDHYDPETEAHYKKGDPIPCESKYKVMLFEDVTVTLEIIEAARGFASEQISEEQKNSERSSAGSPVPENSQTKQLASA